MEATGKKRCADKLGCHGCEMATNARHADIVGGEEGEEETLSSPHQL